jgi:hypothetical protein
MPEYLLLLGVRADPWRALSSADRARMHRKIASWFGRLRASGRIRDQRKLGRANTATTVSLRDGLASVTIGPINGPDELLVASVVVDAPDADAAIELAKSWPVADAVVEVRPCS